MIERIGSATSNELESAITNLASTRTELSSTKSAIKDLTTKLNGKIRNTNLKFLNSQERNERI
jgi:hypothetical protein